MSGSALAKKGDPTLIAAVRRYVANGGTWSDFVQLAAPEFGAVMREGAIDGWSKPKIVFGEVEVSDDDLDNAIWSVFVNGREIAIAPPPKKKRKAASRERRR